jgi:hypothetical protein
MDETPHRFFSVFVERNPENSECRVVMVFEGFDDVEEATDFVHWLVEEIAAEEVDTVH